MAEIWVKAAHPRAHFYQEVMRVPEGGGQMRLTSERVFAPTFLQDGHPDHGVQIPVPMKVTDSPAVRNALREAYPLSATEGVVVPASIVQCLDEEVQAYLGNRWHEEQQRRDSAHADAVKQAEAAKAAAADPTARVAELERQVAQLLAERNDRRTENAPVGGGDDSDDDDGDGDEPDGNGGEPAAQPRVGGRFASKKA